MAEVAGEQRRVRTAPRDLAERQALGGPGTGGAGGSRGQTGGGEGASWWQSATGIEAKGADCWRPRKAGEEFQRYKVGVFKVAGEGPWRQALLADMLRTKNTAYAAVHEFFYGHPPVEGAL